MVVSLIFEPPKAFIDIHDLRLRSPAASADKPSASAEGLQIRKAVWESCIVYKYMHCGYATECIYVNMCIDR